VVITRRNINENAVKTSGLLEDSWACLIDLFQFGQNGWPNSLTGRYVAAGNYNNWDACLTAFLKGSTSGGVFNRRRAAAFLFYSEKPNHPRGPGIHYVHNA